MSQALNVFSIFDVEALESIRASLQAPKSETSDMLNPLSSLQRSMRE
jgi:hypothetical protein